MTKETKGDSDEETNKNDPLSEQMNIVITKDGCRLLVPPQEKFILIK